MFARAEIEIDDIRVDADQQRTAGRGGHVRKGQNCEAHRTILLGWARSRWIARWVDPVGGRLHSAQFTIPDCGMTA